MAGGLRALGSLPAGALEAARKVVPMAGLVAACVRMTLTSLLGAGAVVFVASVPLIPPSPLSPGSLFDSGAQAHSDSCAG